MSCEHPPERTKQYRTGTVCLDCRAAEQAERRAAGKGGLTGKSRPARLKPSAQRKRDVEIVALAAVGGSQTEIAEKVHASTDTVRHALARMQTDEELKAVWLAEKARLQPKAVRLFERAMDDALGRIEDGSLEGRDLAPIMREAKSVAFGEQDRWSGGGPQVPQGPALQGFTPQDMAEVMAAFAKLMQQPAEARAVVIEGERVG